MKDKTARTFELIAALILGIYCLVMIFYAVNNPITTVVDGMRSYTFPVYIYIIMLLCCSVLIIQNRIIEHKRKKEYAALSEDEKNGMPAEERESFHFQKIDRRVWCSVLLIISYIFLWKIIGFTLATVLFVTIEAKVLYPKDSLIKCLLIGIAIDLLIYLVFVRLFAISLPETFLADILR